METEDKKELVLKLKECIQDKKIDACNVVEILSIMMKNAETFSNLKGQEKKELVIRTLGMVISEMIEDDEDKGVLEKMLQSTLPYMIDALVLADKKGLFEKGVKQAKRCLKFC